VIRIVVTFLVAFQSLVPPGMCLCQFVPCAVNPRSKETAPAMPASRTASAAEPCCSCAARWSAAGTKALSPAGDRAALDREALPKHSCPHPAPGEPWPDCPVVSAGPEARAAILPAAEQAAADTAVHFGLLIVEASSPRAVVANLLVAPSAPPLFVRHCALLI
jgi:hypothetical protein